MRLHPPKLIVNTTRASVVCERGVIADRPLARMRGLLGRSALPAGDGLLLRPAPSIHTAFMRFPIDAVFLDANLRVVKLVPWLGPWRTATARHARAVLELAEGESERRGVEMEDRLDVLEPEIGCPAPTRVLLATSDRRFRTVASTLLTRRGCCVTVDEGTGRVFDRVSDGGIQVVVIDASASMTAAAQTVARLQRLRPREGVVVVSSDPLGQLAALPVLPKWGSFGSLWAAIERARQLATDEQH